MPRASLLAAHVLKRLSVEHGSSKGGRLKTSGLPPWRCLISFECEDRKRLQQQYVEAVNAYGEAVGMARSPLCADPDLARRLTQDTSVACQKALKAFTDHIEEHGC
jgi:hypothetical protein